MATTLILVVGVTLIISAMCSLLEATLYSTRVAILEAAKTDGHQEKVPGTLLWYCDVEELTPREWNA